VETRRVVFLDDKQLLPGSDPVLGVNLVGALLSSRGATLCFSLF
jgi:hypothetical protein